MLIILSIEKFPLYEETEYNAKNLAPKTLIAYRSDLKDFYLYFHTNGLNDLTIIEYVQHLSQERHLQDSTCTMLINSSVSDFKFFI